MSGDAFHEWAAPETFSMTENAPRDRLFAGNAIPLDPGDPVLIAPQGSDNRLKTYYIGHEVGRFLILALAPLTRDGAFFKNFLQRGRRTRIFHTCQGVVHGYASRVLGYTTSPYRHLHLAYPDESEFANLRREDRVDCHIPASVEYGRGLALGMVVDINRRGAAVSLCGEEQQYVEGVGQGQELFLRFYLRHDQDMVRVPCLLKRASKVPDKTLLALVFSDLPQQVRERIDEFIQTVTAYTP